MSARRVIVAACSMLFVACTSTSPSTSPLPSSAVPPVSPSVSPTPVGATLADGSPLPSGCDGKVTPDQTVGFVSAGRAWALDPTSGRVACLFATADPGAFTFGPQGDRVLLADMRVRAVGADVPTWPPDAADTPSVFDWGHPLGLAVIYVDGAGAPRKRLMDDGSVERLSSLPVGTYRQIAYHPSGLAIGFILDQQGHEGIWIATNEGKDPERLVFAEPGTTFTSLAFSNDGQRLWWIAVHDGTRAEVHWMDLADRSGFVDAPSEGLAPTAHRLLLSPDGARQAATQGAACDKEEAVAIDDHGATPVMRGTHRPTHALGWLDGDTLLVARGGCGDTQDLFAVHVGAGASPAVLVSGADAAAPRTVLRDAPAQVPAPSGDATPAPPGGVG
jgi:hypothetical protein